MLNELLLAYRAVLSDTVDRVQHVTGLRASSRVKTRTTTIEKLKRHGGSWLKSMQDLAGMRIVVQGGRAVQDRVVERVVAEFAGGRRPPLVIDRRLTPMHGYRAVHVVVYPEDAQVEIQVRTEIQHLWAEQFEKLADQVGRGIRYGESVVASDPAERRMRQTLVDQLQLVAEVFDDMEREDRESSSLSRLAVAALATFGFGVIASRIDAMSDASAGPG